MQHRLTAVLGTLILAACSSSTTTVNNVGTGGGSSAGGSSSIGGTSSTAKSGSLGGATHVAGSSALGGTSSAAGSTAVAGATTAGGTSNAGGTQTAASTAVIAGSSATGGTAATSGTMMTGGTTTVGGTHSTGGSAAVGGASTTPAAGGSATGGAATGGAATGGAATGGAATGGAATGGAATGGAATGGASGIVVPVGWTCPASHYHSGDGCDCGCGVIDPDCSATVLAYLDPYSCRTAALPGSCAASAQFPNSTIKVDDYSKCYAPPPSAWVCDAAAYYDDLCQAGCGLADPGCATQPNRYCGWLGSCTYWGYYWNRNASNYGCNYISSADSSTCSPAVPPAWSCAPNLYNDGICDCGCGAKDPDCSSLSRSVCEEWTYDDGSYANYVSDNPSVQLLTISATNNAKCVASA
jgi:hypothetical protein